MDTTESKERGSARRGKRMNLSRLALTSLGVTIALMSSMSSSSTAEASPQPVGVDSSTRDWRTIYSDNFNTILNEDHWYRYVGVSSASHSAFAPAQVTMGAGSLRLTDAKQPDGTW